MATPTRTAWCACSTAAGAAGAVTRFTRIPGARPHGAASRPSRALPLPQSRRPSEPHAALRRADGTGDVRARPALRADPGGGESAMALRAWLPAATGLSGWLARTGVCPDRGELRAAQVPRYTPQA